MNTVANTILEQLGGNRFCAMTGAKNFVYGENLLQFSIAKAKDGINKVRIVLNSNDLYDVEFYKIKKWEADKISERSDVYAENLQEIFTNHTGMYTRL